MEDGQTQTALQILNTAVILDLLGRIEGWGGILKLNRQFTGRSLDLDVDLTVFDLYDWTTGQFAPDVYSYSWATDATGAGLVQADGAISATSPP